jgi:excisionase family DNA binding protein
VAYPPSDFVTTDDAAEMLGVSRRRVNELVADGHLEPSHRHGLRHFFHRHHVEQVAREGWPGRRGKPSENA